MCIDRYRFDTTLSMFWAMKVKQCASNTYTWSYIIITKQRPGEAGRSCSYLTERDWSPGPQWTLLAAVRVVQTLHSPVVHTNWSQGTVHGTTSYSCTHQALIVFTKLIKIRVITDKTTFVVPSSQLWSSYSYSSLIFGSRTDLIPLLIYLVVVLVILLLVVATCSKSPRHRRFKSDRDEIWHDCSSS